MKKEGLLVLKTPEIELHLSPMAIKVDIADQSIDDVKEIQNKEEDRDTALFWSAPGNLGEGLEQ